MTRGLVAPASAPREKIPLTWLIPLPPLPCPSPVATPVHHSRKRTAESGRSVCPAQRTARWRQAGRVVLAPARAPLMAELQSSRLCQQEARKRRRCRVRAPRFVAQPARAGAAPTPGGSALFTRTKRPADAIISPRSGCIHQQPCHDCATEHAFARLPPNRCS